MRENYEEELTRDMRVAYTRACVAFPRINKVPITLAVYHVFADVFYELKQAKRWSVRRELDPLDKNMVALLTEIVDRAKAEIIDRNVPLNVTRGMTGIEAKQNAMMVSGLDEAGARTLVQFAKTARSREEIMQKRTTMLQNRRNLLANNLTADALRIARTYFLSEGDDA